MPQRFGTFTKLLLLVLCFWLAQLSVAQNFGDNVTIKPIKGFKVAEPYGPPHETQIKSLLQGGKALPQPGGATFLSEGVILKTFTETNTPQLIVKCQECVYNSTNREVHSAGPIQMQTADGKFFIEGTGFFFQQTNSTLFISNDVHTLIQSASIPQGTVPQSTNAIKNPEGAENGPLFINSGKFSYDGSSGRGMWWKQVVVVGTNVTGTNLVLKSELLTGTMPADQGTNRQVKSLLAQTNVVVDYNGLKAKGGRLAYAPETGLIRLTERAKWESGERRGQGDELVLDRTNQIFRVNGHAFLHLPGQTMGESGFLSYSNSPGSKSTNAANRSIEISSDNYEFRTNWAIFREHVQLNELLYKTNRGKMSAQKSMIVTFAGTNQLQTLTAEKNVVISEGERKITGGRAFYTHTNTTLEVTGQPAWQDGVRNGKGDLLRVNTQQSEMLVQGNASMTLPANELAGQFSPASTNAIIHLPKAGTNQSAQIFCEKYLLRPDKSVFQGGVYATHPEMNWTCENLTVRVPNTGITNVVAHQNVVFDLMTARGKVHGTGDEAIYSFGMLNNGTNGTHPINELRLNGTPALLVTTNMTSRNNTVIWDRLNDKIRMPGSDYSIQGTAKAPNTNIFVLPKKKLTK